MVGFTGLQDAEIDLQPKFVPIRNHLDNEESENLINLKDNPEFGLTFGRPDPQLINQLFDTPPIKIHTKIDNLKISLKTQACQPCSLRSRAQSAIPNRLLSKEIDFQKLRQNMSRITYSIKTIQCKNDQEIGISSRRVIMGNKLLQAKKNFLSTKYNTQRSRCTSYSKEAQITDESRIQQSRFESEKLMKRNLKIHHNKFHSKRLNVIVKKKRSNFPKDLEAKELNNSLNSFKNFQFDINSNTNWGKQKAIDSHNAQNSLNTIESDMNRITFRSKKQNRSSTIQNKRLKYEKLMSNKRSSQKFDSIERKLSANNQPRVPFGQKLISQNQLQLMSERKRKVSLSNIMNQYHTEIIQNSSKVLIERSNFCQTLKELFKNKFSTISKTLHEERNQMLETNLIKIKMRKHSFPKRQFGNDMQNRQQKIGTMKKFKKYQQIQKENACLLDGDN